MRTLSILLVAISLFFTSANISAQNPIHSSDLVFRNEFSLADIAETAKTQDKWSFLFCAVEGNTFSAQQEEIMQSNKDFANFVNRNFTAYQFDAFNDIEKTQNWDIRQFPTILILNEKGEEMTRMSGIHDVDEIVSKISRLPGFDSRRKVENELAYFQKRGTDASVAFMDVTPFKHYSVTTIREDGFGLKIGTYNTKQALQAELNKISKGWHKEIFIYSQVDKSKECFNLVLGNYQDYEEAKRMQGLILDNLLIKSSVISFAKIKDRFVEEY